MARRRFWAEQRNKGETERTGQIIETRRNGGDERRETRDEKWGVERRWITEKKIVNKSVSQSVADREAKKDPQLATHTTTTTTTHADRPFPLPPQSTLAKSETSLCSRITPGRECRVECWLSGCTGVVRGTHSPTRTRACPPTELARRFPWWVSTGVLRRNLAI